VGTITEINDYVKQLLPRVVDARCPQWRAERCGRRRLIPSHLRFLPLIRGHRLLVTFWDPGPGGDTAQGRFSISSSNRGICASGSAGRIVRVDQPEEAGELPAVVQVIQDRVTVTKENRSRFCESARKRRCALEKGKVLFDWGERRLCRSRTARGGTAPIVTSTSFPPSPGLFSFNNPQGACPSLPRLRPERLPWTWIAPIPDRRLSIAEGAVKPFQTENGSQCQEDLEKAARKRRFEHAVPVSRAPGGGSGLGHVRGSGRPRRARTFGNRGSGTE